jgi:hypothetical protein
VLIDATLALLLPCPESVGLLIRFPFGKLT